MGSEITLTHDLQARDARINELNIVLQTRDNQIIELYSTIRVRDIQIEELKGVLQEINQSVTWQMVMKFQRIIDRLLPEGTRRRRWYDMWINGLGIIANQGFKQAIIKFKEHRREQKN